jgi:hypothetical protein
MRVDLNSCLGVAICAGTAFLLSIFLSDGGESRLAAPVLCLLVAISTSSYFGRLSGFIGSVVASLTCALLLFPPVGSFVVHDPAARTMLILCQLTAVGVLLIWPRHSILKMTSEWQLRRTASNDSERELLKLRDSH